VELQAHSAALGLVFYDGEMYPADFTGDLFVAYHGSWNRTVPTGYKVVRIPFENGEVAGEVENFVWGWQSAAGVSGRPVGLAVGPDGALYVSDDFGGRIYRVVYNP
jgi:glucose/arabinose dehydrogenase